MAPKKKGGGRPKPPAPAAKPAGKKADPGLWNDRDGKPRSEKHMFWGIVLWVGAALVALKLLF